MDSLTLNQIAGEHLPIYEKYFQQVNPSNSNIIKALDAATFIRKSGLNQLTLKTIWDLSDPNCLGYLDKKALFVALKLIAMVQNGRTLNIKDLKVPTPPPAIGDNVLETLDWSIPQENIQGYIVKYHSLNPIDGKLAGSKVKPYMVESKLQLDILTRVWDLSDIDQDGFLDMKEFIISCHLISKVIKGFNLPSELPSDLLNFNPLEKSQAVSPDSSSKSNEISQWIVPSGDKATYDIHFTQLDKDNDGFVNGFDVKDTLLQSGLPQNVLAHIWNLCDIKGDGKLNQEQFSLANYFIKQKQNGLELPMQLAANMIPPSLRPKLMESVSNEDLNSQSSTGNKEFDILMQEIKQLQINKIKYESEVTSEEASLRLKQSEIKNIQNEIESLSQMLKQLENQKNDASKRLEDLNSQLGLLEISLHELRNKFCMENDKVENFNCQLIEQKKKISDEENDLVSKRTEFEDLKNEEVRLESKLSTSKSEAEQVSKNAADTQLEISQLKSNLLELEEYKRRVNETLNDYDSAIINLDYVKIASLLPRSLTPPQFLEDKIIDDFNESKVEFNSDPFAGEDPFKDDPFSSEKAAEAFGNDDNFANFDAFGNGFSNKENENKSDPFGFSPFTESTAAGDTFRSESPTPALPPKKSKAPPPRPAPPKSSNKTPLRAAPPPPAKDISKSSSTFNSNFDPFGSDSFSSQNFANFADLDKS